MVRVLRPVVLLLAVSLFPLVCPGSAMAGQPVAFSGDVVTASGDWHADVAVSDSAWRPGGQVRVQVVLGFTDAYLGNRATAGVTVDEVCVLVTGERTFDQDGWMRLASDETVSTLLTPTGLAIEGGVQGAVTNRYGYPFKSPVDVFQSQPIAQIPAGSVTGTRQAAFSVDIALPWDLPPGLYRLRVDVGVKSGKRLYDLNGYTFAARPFTIPGGGTASYLYSPVLESSGFDVAGRYIDASTLQARCPWVLLGNYNSNGYRGVVADEDASRFALSPRTLIPDDVVLPMYSDGGSRLTYSLEPQFPVDQIDAAQNLAWNWTAGEWSVQVTAPDGSTTNLGTATFQAKAKYGGGPTTNWTAMTNWKPPSYGRYTVKATGWIADATGRRYFGGGTYRFWIAKRMTLATATFQGMPYPVGTSYGRDIQFNPALPADVQVTATLYPDSDPGAARELTYCGKASPGGLFGAAQGMKPFLLDAPGEYHAKVLATYTDPGGHLWVSVMRHAGIVYPQTSPVIARGKKISVGGKYVERGSTGREGYVETNGTQHLEHLTFPYLSGDVLLIASENQGANKVEPVLTYQLQGDASAWDTKLTGVGTTNLRIKTSNGYAPHMFPEYITDFEYYYGAAPRPGFMGRFVVGESTSRAPYWAVSPNSFGGQIGASANGDAPGDIYRLLGGVVLRRVGQDPMYAGYLSSAFLLPRGTNDNRIVAAGSEDFHGPMGEKARFFLVGLRPGTSYEVGATFKLGGQIDPILPAAIHFVLTYPDGRQQVADVTGDAYGAFGAPAGWALDVPGVYRYQLTATWNGHEGRMPGLPESGGTFFVYSKSRPASAAGLSIDGSPHRTFSASATTTITGSSTGTSVHYTMVTPGAVIAQGELPVVAGKFTLVFDPAAVHAKVPLYDVVNNATGAAQIGRVVHVTFFSEEFSGGQSFHDVTRVLLRGTTVLAARELLPDAERHVLTVGRVGQGTIAVPTGQGEVECDSCSLPMASGATVTLTATAAPGSVFTGWTGACSGTGPCTVTVSGATSVGAVFASGAVHRRYFAEGAATTFFDCVFALANPGDTSAHVTMRFLKDGGTTVVHTLDVPAGARRSVDAKLVPGLAPAPGFSTVIESDVPVVADRTMSWDRTGYGMHAEVAVEAPARTWYLAEGSTQNGLQLYYLLENPNEREASVEVTYLRPAPLAPIVRLYSMAPLSRRTILVNDEDPGLQSVDVSGVVSSLDAATPIIVERAMYLDAQGQFFAAGAVSAGVTSPSADWFFAEGATAAPFDMYLLLANPGDMVAHVTVRYLLQDGRALTKTLEVEPKSRLTTWVDGVVDEEDPHFTLASEAVSVSVASDVPVLAERAMWWPAGSGGWREAHSSAGTTDAGTAWAVAGGEQGGARGVETYVLVANTSPFAGRVRVTLLPEQGGPATYDLDIAANSRTTLSMGGTSPTPSTPFGGRTADTRFGVLVESQSGASDAAQIVVERAMYWNAPGESWAAGSDIVGTRLR